MPYINPNYLITIQQSPGQGVPVFNSKTQDQYTSDSRAGGIVIHAAMPGQFGFDTRAEYAAPFAQGLFGNNMLTNLAKVAGIRLVSQAMTAQVWQGSTETELSLELEFQAESDPNTEVRLPILALMKLATASIDESSDMLKSPGPQLNLTTELFNSILNQSAKGVNAAIQKVGTLGDIGATAAKLTPEQQLATNNADAALAEASKKGLGTTAYWKSQISNQISIAIGRYAFFDSIVISNVMKTYESQIDAATGLPMYAKVSISFKPLFLLVQSDLDNIFALR